VSRAHVELSELCDRVVDGAALDRAGLERLLSTRGAEAQTVFAAAREVRRRRLGDAVFLYGFVYFSTFCVNRCTFCLYRAGNAASPRYRKTTDEAVAICRELGDSGVVLVDLTMGEDPEISGASGSSPLLELVGAVREASGLSVMVSPGVVSERVLTALRARGADWYALYQETHTPALYARLRIGQSFAARAEARRRARRAGLLVEDGILTGVGDTVADRARSILAMRDAGCEQVRAMTLVPQAGTPFASVAPPEDLSELLAIAAMRLAMPDRLIPASLDVQGVRGLARRLDAGADAVTSIVPPDRGLCGVSHAHLDIADGSRTVDGVRPRLADLGLRVATPDEYRARLAAARGCR
jgi:methylornithine synthase